MASLDMWHGRCYGFENERSSWAAPRVVVSSDAEARPGYQSMDASEYVEEDATFQAKVKALARLVRQSQHCIIYSGAGLSTGAGIGDYASQPGSLNNTAPPPRSAMLAEIQSRAGSTEVSAGYCAADTPTFRSPLCAQPTLAHRALVAMHAAGHVHRWINQNHDGLPQKAGLPQEAINEIHGAWHAPDNTVVAMTGSLRDDLYADLCRCEREADLSIAVGTSLCGMNADCVVSSVADRAAKGQKGQLGSVVIGLQRTVLDESSTLRIFGRCDDVLAALAQELSLAVAPSLPAGEYFVPAVLAGRREADYIFEGIPYDESGIHSSEVTSTLDMREDVELVIPSGIHAGAVGVVDGFDREGNIRAIFKLKPKVGKLRAPVPLLIGRWWIQAAVKGTVPLLPVVNKPGEEQTGKAADHILQLVEKYMSP